MNTLSLDLKTRYSYADYLTWLDNKRRELIDGFIKMMSAPKPVHQKISLSLSANIIEIIKKNKGNCEVYQDIDVRLPINGNKEDGSIYDVVRPDISILCDKSKIDENGCLGAPDMIIEIQSFSTAKYDLTTKFNLYEKAGVKEYWVIYPVEKGIEVFLLQDNGKYDDGTRYDTDKVPIGIFNGCSIDLYDVFN